jgi:hypothetical protein
MSPELTKLIADIDALEKRATPGEWVARDRFLMARNKDGFRFSCYVAELKAVDNRNTDARLIATLKNAWPQLRAALAATDKPA